MKFKSTFLLLTALISGYKIALGQFSYLWDAKFAHSSGLTIGYSNESRKIAVDSNGNIFVLADVVSDYDPNGLITGSTYHYTVILKYDLNGSLLNQVDINVNNHVNSGFTNYGAFGLEIDASQNIYIGYASYNTVSDYDVIVAKYTNNLSLLWTTTYPSTRLDQGVSMAINSSSGNVFTVVKSTNTLGITTYHVVKFSNTPVTASLIYSFETGTEVVHSMKYDGGGSRLCSWLQTYKRH